MGVRKNFSKGGQRRNFSHPFQVPRDAGQADGHKRFTISTTLRNSPCYGRSHKNALRWQWQHMLLFTQYKTA